MIYSRFDKIFKPTNQEYISHNSQITLDLINNWGYRQIPKYCNLYRIFDARIYKIESKNFHNHNTLKEYFS